MQKLPDLMKPMQRLKKRVLTINYFHRAPSVYSKNQSDKIKILNEFQPRLNHHSHSFEDFYENPITNMIREDIIERPRKALMRRKSCHCSECGKLTSLELKVMALSSMTHMRMLELDAKNIQSYSDLGQIKGRGRTGTTDSKLST